MDSCDVKLTNSRSGPKLNQAKGDIVPVGLLEAARLIDNGGCERPGAKVMKAIAAAVEAAAVETASAVVKPHSAEDLAEALCGLTTATTLAQEAMAEAGKALNKAAEDQAAADQAQAKADADQVTADETLAAAARLAANPAEADQAAADTSAADPAAADKAGA